MEQRCCMTLDNIVVDFENPLSVQETKNLLRFISKEIDCKVEAGYYTSAIRKEEVSYEPNSPKEKPHKMLERFQDIEGKMIKKDLSMGFRGIRYAGLKVCGFIGLEFDVSLSYIPTLDKELKFIENVKQKVKQYTSAY